MDFKSSLSYLGHHIVLLALVVLLAFGSVYGIESLVAKHDAASAGRLESIVTALEQQVQTSQAQVAQLAQIVSQRNAQNQQQQRTDASLSAQEAANRLASQTAAAPGEITVSGDLTTIDLPITRKIVGAFDDLATTKANLADTQGALQASQGTVAQQTQLIADKDKACASELKTAHADARKGKLKWFGIGLVTGYLVGRVSHVLGL